jgi:hypothetical protein
MNGLLPGHKFSHSGTHRNIQRKVNTSAVGVAISRRSSAGREEISQRSAQVQLAAGNYLSPYKRFTSEQLNDRPAATDISD